jgi:hypothetical protein
LIAKRSILLALIFALAILGIRERIVVSSAATLMEERRQKQLQGQIALPSQDDYARPPASQLRSDQLKSQKQPLSSFERKAWVDSVEYLSEYQNLARAVAGTNPRSLIIDKKETLSSSVTVGENINLKYLMGCETDTNGYTLAIRGSVDPVPYSCFTGSGSVRITGPVDYVYPQMWGADASGAVDSTSAFQSAVDSVSTGITVRVPAGTYKLGSIEIPDGTKIEGASEMSVTVESAETGDEIFLLASSAANPLSNITITGLAFTGTYTYVFNVTGARNIFHEFKDLRLTGTCAGSSIFRYTHDSLTNQASRNLISRIDARRPGFDSFLTATVGDNAYSENRGYDNFVITECSHWARYTGIYITAPWQKSKLSNLYFAMWSSATVAPGGQHAIHIDGSGGDYSLNNDISNIHVEFWENDAYGVYLNDVSFSTIRNLSFIRVDNTRTGYRSMYLEGSDYNIIINPEFRDTGTDPGSETSTCYLEFDSASDWNQLFYNNQKQIFNRVYDAGVGNRIYGDKGDLLVYANHDPYTTTNITERTTVYDYTIKGGHLTWNTYPEGGVAASKHALKITAFGNADGADAKQFGVFLGDNSLGGYSNTTAGYWQGEWNMFVTADAAQMTHYKLFWNGALVDQGVTETTVDLTADAECAFKYSYVVDGSGVQLDSFIIEPRWAIGVIQR